MASCVVLWCAEHGMSAIEYDSVSCCGIARHSTLCRGYGRRSSASRLIQHFMAESLYSTRVLTLVCSTALRLHGPWRNSAGDARPRCLGAQMNGKGWSETRPGPTRCEASQAPHLCAVRKNICSRMGTGLAFRKMQLPSSPKLPVHTHARMYMHTHTPPPSRPRLWVGQSLVRSKGRVGQSLVRSKGRFEITPSALLVKEKKAPTSPSEPPSPSSVSFTRALM